ncbi:MAG TPA: hypothetical protein VNT81_03445 [Vicinamibacterales bacterium]|nr:hypothetical protein [Vicinamibacterales bacterium]
MDAKLIAAIAALSMTMATAPARAQHGGGTLRGGVVGRAVPRLPPALHVSGPLHTAGGRYYPSLHATIRFGLTAGYPYYEYAWPYGYGRPFAHPNAFGAPGYGYSGFGYPPAITEFGEIRFQGAPKDAQVYVDRYYAGIVDDFDGTFQWLNVERGPHQIEIVVPAAPPLTFDVNVEPGRTITIRP